MKTKTMRKLVALSAMAALMVSGVTTVFATNINTSLMKDTSGGVAPIVKAKWEANTDRFTDDNIAAGAQFLPSGQFNVHKTISICAVVTDPDGLADIDNVYADVFYPNVALGEHHVKLPNQSGEGCGAFMQEDLLRRLTKEDGYDLFCNKVHGQNNNLPTFNEGYDYAEICAADGELMKDTAAVYCGEKTISYEDPSGDYEVWAVAQDKNGQQGILKNHFSYQPMTAFETDFASVDYGNVRLNTHKIIPGDLVFGAGTKASVRNVGNTRIRMKVKQDDMGLGETSGVWNVRYDARVGSGAAYANYNPEEEVVLNDQLDLSELDEMDFSILVKKFPPTHEGDSYSGNMMLGAMKVPHLTCETAPVAGS